MRKATFDESAESAIELFGRMSAPDTDKMFVLKVVEVEFVVVEF